VKQQKKIFLNPAGDVQQEGEKKQVGLFFFHFKNTQQQ